MFLTLIIFLIVLSLLVFVHEFGHFYTAQKCGIKAEEFGFGYPPRAFGVYKKQDGRWHKVWGNKEIKDAKNTVYSINWIPLGGFVKIKGEDGQENSDQDNFNNHSIWQRALVISAGVIMNIVLAVVLVSVGFMIGLPHVIEDVNSHAIVKDQQVQVMQILPSSAADGKLQEQDVIYKVNDKIIKNETDLQEINNTNIGQELNYVIKRDNQELDVKLTPQFIEETGKGGIGVAIVTTGMVKYPWYWAIWQGIKTTFLWLWLIILAFYEMIKGLIVGQGLPTNVAGPVGIASMTGQFAKMGFVYLLQFVSLLSLNLAILNFLPFPALDGGRIIFLIIEKLKGSPVKREVEAIIHNIGFTLLMILVVVITFKDVSKFSYVFKNLWNKIF